MRLQTLQDLLFDQLLDIYNAEYQISQALPRITKAASSPDLKQALQSHQKTNQEQISRLNVIFTKLGLNHNHHVCQGMKGLIGEEFAIIESEGNPLVKDAALIAAAQRIEHYEIALYGTVKTYARELGYNDIADLLQNTLNEESEIDKQFTSLAKGGFFSPGINEEAPKK